MIFRTDYKNQRVAVKFFVIDERKDLNLDANEAICVDNANIF